MSQVNKELQSLREQQDLKLSRQLEENDRLRHQYDNELLAKQNEIHELEDMKNRLAAKEEIEERLVSEKDEVVLQLSKVQHQLATLQSQVGGSGSEELESMDKEESEKEEMLVKELREQAGHCLELEARCVQMYMHVMLLDLYSRSKL